MATLISTRKTNLDPSSLPGVEGRMLRRILNWLRLYRASALLVLCCLAAAASLGVVPPLLVKAVVGIVELLSRLRRKPAPINRDVFQILGRYAWYDTARARAELGWAPRPLKDTLADTIRWLREQPSNRS